MNVRSVQFNMSTDVTKNIQHALKLASEKSLENIDVLVFPEMFTTGYQLDKIQDLAHEKDDYVIQQFKSFAKQHSISIVLGSVAIKHGEKITNTTFVINPAGEIISEYSKTHLFGLMNEPDYMEAGNSAHVFTIKETPCTSIICYDLRFPELTRNITLSHQTKVIFVPMEWPAPRTEAFRTLLRARAIENQCFVVSCNRVGKAEESDAVFEGSSMIIDPFGNVINEIKNEEGFIDATLDLAVVDKVRSTMTCFEDRRTDLYSKI